MKLKYIILFVLIIILHCGLAYYFFFYEEDKPKPLPEKIEENIPKPAPKPAQKLGEIPDIVEDVDTLDDIAIKNPRLGKRLNYTYSTSGNIKAIPASKNAKTGILVDLDTRYVLWDKNPRKSVPIASMTKMMTILIAMEKITENPAFTLDTPVKVTASASKIGGSQVWLDPQETFPLKDLLKSMIIHSANDSAELIAEFFGNGDRNKFVKMMNQKARQLRMGATRYFNPHGLSGRTSKEDNVSCCEAQVFLAEQLLEYPEVMKWAATWMDYIREHTNKPTQLTNRNKLVKTCAGVDGLKTGFTNRAMFCITASCLRNGRRLIAVATGFPTSKQRNDFISKLFDWGYKQHPGVESVPK